MTHRAAAALVAIAVSAVPAAAATCSPPSLSISYLPANDGAVLTALPDQPIEPFHESTFGLTTTKPEFSVKITPVHAEGLCIDRVEATLSVTFVDGIVVALHPRLAEGSCARDKVIEHEQIHVGAALKGAAAALDAGTDAVDRLVTATDAPSGGQTALWSASLPAISAAMKAAYRAASDPINFEIDTRASIKATIAACDDWPTE